MAVYQRLDRLERDAKNLEGTVWQLMRLVDRLMAVIEKQALDMRVLTDHVKVIEELATRAWVAPAQSRQDKLRVTLTPQRLDEHD